MEIWDSLNRRYLDFIKTRGVRREESWLFRGLREPGRGRAEELARRALGPGSGFLPKKGKAGKKCEEAAGGEGERRPRDGGQHGRLVAPRAGTATGVAVARARSREPRRARYAAGSSARPWPGAMVSKLLQLDPDPTSPSGCAGDPRIFLALENGIRDQGRRGRGALGGVGASRCAPGAHLSPQPRSSLPSRAEGRRFPSRFPAGGGGAWDAETLSIIGCF